MKLTFVITLILWLLLATGCATFFSQPYTTAIPKRPDTALNGSEFIKNITKTGDLGREKAILKEIRRGNIPPYIRDLKPITYEQTLNTGRSVEVTFWVTPDYLAIGSNTDYIRIPMNPITAQRIADHFGCVLPTTKMVDKIFEQAEVKLKPATFTPGEQMVRTEQFAKHHQLIQQQLKNYSQGDLVAGHKKDVVISNRLQWKSQRVAIYGWHKANGQAIQPLSTIHGDYYADYSHGVRLISGTMSINGMLLPVVEVLQDPILSQTISYEGTLKSTRYPTALYPK